MRSTFRLYGTLLCALALSAGTGCGNDQGPRPTVRLLLQGLVRSAEPTTPPIAGARVDLRQFQDILSDPHTIAKTTTDQFGRYELTHIFTSACEPEDNTTFWLEVSADGYESVSTFVVPEFSDPMIRCTGTPQVIDLSLIPYGSLQVITQTSGPTPPPTPYALRISGVDPHAQIEYPMAANDQLTIPNLRPGQYPLELAEVPSTCVVGGDNPRTITVAARSTTTTTFDVSCVAETVP